MLDHLFPLAVSAASWITVIPNAALVSNSHSAPASQSDTGMFDIEKKEKEQIPIRMRPVFLVSAIFYTEMFDSWTDGM